ncbi:MAG: hypothetical protein IT374_24845 [Polyangiaceae bacterium]|nr:hypothetical protein [Polyangiaceae bacterium]
MARRSTITAALALLLPGLGCGDASSKSAFDDAAGAAGQAQFAAGSGGASAGAGGGFQSQGGGSSTTTPSCDEVGASIFVVSSPNSNLLKFDPKTYTFTQIGKLSCGAGLATPFSMAIRRDGNAYILHSNGRIYRASTKDASCVDSGYSPNQQGFSQFGMGYVSDGPGSQAETLFVMDSGAAGLAKIPDDGKLVKVAQFDGGLAGRSGEVTGTGEGRLFGFFVDVANAKKTSVAEIDKATGHVISNVAQGLPQISAWAFAHWGGSFYLFNGSGGGSRVHKYTPGKGTTQVVADAGQSIVGAGVSTCAPIAEPE